MWSAGDTLLAREGMAPWAGKTKKKKQKTENTPPDSLAANPAATFSAHKCDDKTTAIYFMLFKIK